MRSTLKSVLVAGCLAALLLLSSGPIAGSGNAPVHSTLAKQPVSVKSGALLNTAAPATGKPEALMAQAGIMYDSLRLRKTGLSKKAFEYAWTGHQRLVKRNKIYRESILSICDFSQSSRRKRLYIFDVVSKKLLLNTYVAHGRNSGGEYARAFSNRPESHQSSLGFYITRNIYFGDHGLALKIDGLEKGFNDRADERNIVIHGSRYVGADFLKYNRFNGRSFGCPAVPSRLTPKVIHTIKNGTCLFIYHPTKKYLNQSRILNS